MSDSPSTAPQFRKAAAYLLFLAVALAGGWETYRVAKLHLALEYAHRELGDRQFMRAEFWTNRAFGVDPDNIQAERLMAEINEAQDKPDALTWRMKVAQREPDNTADLMAFAKCALRFGQSQMAESALQSLPRDFMDHSAEYHELMAGFAMSNHQPAVAEVDFEKAAQLDHDNPVNAVNLAAFQLNSSLSRDVQAMARRELESVLDDPRVSVFAARALLADALRSGDRARAGRFAAMLQSNPDHSFTDDLSCLDAGMSAPGFQAALDAVEDRAASNAPWTAEAGDWLNAHGMAAETLRWYAKLPAAIRADIPVQMTMSEAYAATRDWSGLAAYLATCHWDGGEFMRRAMRVRCERELGQPWENDWDNLVADVNAHPPDGLLLSQMIARWNWRNEIITLLWGAAADPKRGAQALEYLWGLYSQTNDTVDLLRVAKARMDLDSTNPALKNNYAFLSLLLFGWSEHAGRLAQEASTANPNIPEWAATYAYALHLAGKDADAKRVMDRLPPATLERPGIALYYAIVLAANGDTAKAKESLAKLNPNGMLPEERKLAAALAQQLNVASR